MKIGSIQPQALPSAVTKPAAPAAAHSLAAPPQASASVSLSPAGALFAKNKVEPSFDAAKVERIAQSIREGRYTINPDAIADKLINASKLLGSKTP